MRFHSIEAKICIFPKILKKKKKNVTTAPPSKLWMNRIRDELSQEFWGNGIAVPPTELYVSKLHHCLLQIMFILQVHFCATSSTRN